MEYVKDIITNTYSSNTNIRIGSKVYVRNIFKDGFMYNVSSKFEGPFRVTGILILHKLKFIHMCNGNKRIGHWNNVKVVPQESDLSFEKLDNESNEANVL